MELRVLETEDRAAHAALLDEARATAPDSFAAGGNTASDRSRTGPAVVRSGELIVGAFELSGALVGIAGLGGTTRSEGVLWGMYVTPARRREGVAAHLVKRVIEIAGALPRMRSLRLHVRADNEPAIRLYTGAGFERIADASELPASDEAEIAMRLELGERDQRTPSR